MLKKNYSGFWKRVKEEIFLKDLSVKEVSISAGIHPSTIYKGLERDSAPDADEAVRVSKALNVNVEYLLYGEVVCNNSYFFQ